ncbi:MAG: hypothetical protein DMG76_37140 [Acidobacteria bacterium]|nr:MAG: hypothetical protein DMG76_37140 [Acidobacteriota bacterium]
MRPSIHSAVFFDASPSVRAQASKAADRYHFKTGQRKVPGTSIFYRVIARSGKSNFVMVYAWPVSSGC